MTQATLPQMVKRGTGRVIIVSSIAGVLAGPAFGPYSMSKFALEAMGKTLRGELFGQGIDVCLLNPGPYLTGFNDRMADSMWDWFGDDSVSAGSTDLFKMMRTMVTEGQMDPQEVVDVMVELVEAESTTENNFVPPNLREQLGLA
jgi:short-subunit dehydrogenase